MVRIHRILFGGKYDFIYLYSQPGLISNIGDVGVFSIIQPASAQTIQHKTIVDSCISFSA